jgi:hypothetical protein
MSVEWIVTGIILLGGMAACGISLYIKRRREAQADLFEATDIKPDLAEPENDET